MSLIKTFRLLASEFASVDDETVQQWLDFANAEVCISGFKGVIRDRLIVYLAADRLVNSHKQDAGGEVASISEGGLSITYAKKNTANYLAMYESIIKAHTITPLTRVC